MVDSNSICSDLFSSNSLTRFTFFFLRILGQLEIDYINEGKNADRFHQEF